MEQKLLKGIDYVGVAVSFFCHDGNGRFVMARGELMLVMNTEHGILGLVALILAIPLKVHLKKKYKKNIVQRLSSQNFWDIGASYITTVRKKGIG